ncbi:hypothetical protein Tco_1048062 [Tanacetum coccineum]
MARSYSGKQSLLATFPRLLSNNLDQQTWHHQDGLQPHQETFLMMISEAFNSVYTFHGNYENEHKLPELAWCRFLPQHLKAGTFCKILYDNLSPDHKSLSRAKR